MCALPPAALDQALRLQADVATLADDDVIVDGYSEQPPGFGDPLRDRDVGAARLWPTELGPRDGTPSDFGRHHRRHQPVWRYRIHRRNGLRGAGA